MKLALFDSFKVYIEQSFTCVGRMLKRFFVAILSLENLSSGLNRAGWAECVGALFGSAF